MNKTTSLQNFTTSPQNSTLKDNKIEEILQEEITIHNHNDYITRLRDIEPLIKKDPDKDSLNGQRLQHLVSVVKSYEQGIEDGAKAHESIVRKQLLDEIIADMKNHAPAPTPSAIGMYDTFYELIKSKY